MRKAFALLILALCLALGVCTAQAEFYAKVYNADSLNVRSGPGSEYAWIASLPRDAQVRVIGESGNWYQVTTLDGGITGYMSKNYLLPVNASWNTPAPAIPIGGGYTDYSAPTYSTSFGVVKDTESLNVRSGPGTEYNWLSSLSRGDWVEITGDSGNWYRVTVCNTGLNGYVSKNYINVWSGGSAGGSMAVVQNPAGTRFLNLRAYPSYDAQILDIFYNGETCQVLNRQSDGWVYVMAYKNGAALYGYFRGEYLAGGGNAGTSAVVNTLQNGGNGGKLNLRAKPSAKSSVVTQIPNGTTLQVYQKGNMWWQVGYSGQFGFVDSGFIQGGGNYTPPATSTAYVRTGNSGKLNLREQPNQYARVLGRYENGTAVSILERGTGWCYVQVDGQQGYMMTQYLSVSAAANTKTVVNNNGGTYVNLRTSPTKTSNNVNVRVPVGSIVTLLSWGQEWSQVSYGGRTGYMMSWFLK